MEETKEQKEETPVFRVDNSRKTYSERVIGFERWTHNTFKVELVFKFYQEEGSDRRFLVGEEVFFERIGEDEYNKGYLVAQVDFTESLHVTRIKEEEKHVCENFVIDVSLTAGEFKDAAIRDARGRLSEEEFKEYEDRVNEFCKDKDMTQVLPAEMHGLYESNVWVRVPDFENEVAKAYLNHFHSISTGDQWSTREIEINKEAKKEKEENQDIAELTEEMKSMQA